METKKEIRSRLKKQRGLLGADECHNMSHDIYKRLIVSELDRDYDNILLYSAIRNEVNTDEYFTYLINKAKRIYYPRVSGNTMSFYRVRSLDELNCGSFNIKEPDMTIPSYDGFRKRYGSSYSCYAYESSRSARFSY